MNTYVDSHLGRPCTCNGSNPNCYRCDGFGYVGEDVVPETRAKVSYVPRRASAARATPATAPVMFYVGVTAHASSVRETQGSINRTNRKNFTPRPQASSVACPACGVLTSRPKKHANKCPATKQAKPVLGGRAKPAIGNAISFGGRRVAARDFLKDAPRPGNGFADERHLDGSRFWHSAFRDGGSFGSHGAFDDYGEEAVL